MVFEEDDMTIDEIIELAREAASGMLSYDAEGNWRLGEREVERFAALRGRLGEKG